MEIAEEPKALALVDDYHIEADLVVPLVRFLHHLRRMVPNVVAPLFFAEYGRIPGIAWKEATCEMEDEGGKRYYLWAKGEDILLECEHVEEAVRWLVERIGKEDWFCKDVYFTVFK